jgi:hypothetical protein
VTADPRLEVGRVPLQPVLQDAQAAALNARLLLDARSYQENKGERIGKFYPHIMWADNN